MIVYDYSKLRGRIKEFYKTESNFARALGMSRVSLSQRLNNALAFDQREISKACYLLKIPPNEISLYFFVGAFEFADATPPLPQNQP